MSGPQQAFRFAELPAETRNAIYELLLCRIPAPRDDSSDDVVHVATELTLLDKNQVNTAILLTNRQIHAEARAVLFKTNLFVKVDILFKNLGNQQNLHKLIINRRVPLLVTSLEGSSASGLQTFDRLLAMTYRITDNAPSNDIDTKFIAELPTSYLLLHRDLIYLCRVLANADDTWLPGFAAKFGHSLIIHEENGHSLGSDSADSGFFASRTVQDRLIVPFREYYKGTAEFSIHSDSAGSNSGTTHGTLDADLITGVVAKVKHKSVKTTLDILEELRGLKQQGNEAYLRGDTRMASEHWARTCLNITRLRTGPEWTKILAAASSTSFSAPGTNEKAFVREVFNMFFNLNLNLAQNTIRHMEQKAAENTAEARDLVPQLANSALGALERAHDEGALAHSLYAGLWLPSATQWAKLWHRKAKAHRLCGDMMGEALQAIEFAEKVAPADAVVLQEKRLIKSLM